MNVILGKPIGRRLPSLRSGCHQLQSIRSLARRHTRLAVRMEVVDEEKRTEICQRVNQDYRLKMYDELVEYQKKSAAEALEKLEEMRATRQDAIDNNYPSFVVTLADWSVNMMQKAYDTNLESVDKADDERKKMATLIAREIVAQDNEDADFIAKIPTVNSGPEAIKAFQQEQAGNDAVAIAFAAALAALTMTWVFSLIGTEAGARLNDAPFTMRTFTTWAAFTLPYLGGTLAVHFAAPHLLGNRSLLRSFHNQELFKLPWTSLASVAVAVGYSRSVIFQGGFLNAFTAFLGGDNATQTAIDPTLVLDDGLQTSLGALVTTQQLPSLLFLLPTVVLTVAVVDAGSFWVTESVQGEINQGMVENLNEQLTVEIESAKTDPDAPQTIKDMLNNVTGFQQSDFVAVMQLPPKMSEDDLFLTACRIALASCWLSTETLLTDNLWCTISTAVLGMILGIALVRGKDTAVVE